jgi:hypothetical protein
MSLLSDFEGHASAVLVLTPCAADYDQPQSLLTGRVGNLLELLPQDCHLFWACASKHLPEAAFEIDGRHVVPIHLPGIHGAPGHAGWVQDPLLVWCVHQDRVILQPVPPLGAAEAPSRLEVDTVLARSLANTLNCPIRSIPLAVEGGNVLRLGDCLLLGRDIGPDNGISIRGPHLHPDVAVWKHLEAKALAELGGKEAVWVGNERKAAHGLRGLPIKNTPSWQPLFHIDLFLLPGGVGPGGEPRLFLGEIQNLNDDALDGADREGLDGLKAMLEEVGESLRHQMPGLQIARLPIITLVTEGQISIESLCNGWVEVSSRGKLAFLPDYRPRPGHDQYSVRRADLHVRAGETLLRWGFQPRWVDMNFPELSRHAGALHCAIKILNRTQ